MKSTKSPLRSQSVFGYVRRISLPIILLTSACKSESRNDSTGVQTFTNTQPRVLVSNSTSPPLVISEPVNTNKITRTQAIEIANEAVLKEWGEKQVPVEVMIRDRKWWVFYELFPGKMMGANIVVISDTGAVKSLIRPN